MFSQKSDKAGPFTFSVFQARPGPALGGLRVVLPVQDSSADANLIQLLAHRKFRNFVVWSKRTILRYAMVECVYRQCMRLYTF